MSDGLPVGGGYSVLNSCNDLTNIVPTDLFKTMLDSVCDKLIDIMGMHCGPNCKYAIIDDPFSSPDKPEFSKDGMDIINSIRFVNRIQDSIRRLLSYCASSSDKIAGDGTTSAMIIAISALKNLNKYLIELEETSGKQIPYRKLSNIYKEFYSKFLSFDIGIKTLDNLYCEVSESLEIQDEKELEILKRALIYHIAYSQAHTSSHGDHELATAVAELFSYTPSDAWEHISYRRSIFETNERFKVEYIKDQFMTSARVMSKSMLNSKLGGHLSFKNATLVALPHPILYTQYGQFTELEKMIKDSVINKKELLIIHTNVLDQHTSQQVLSIFEHLKDEGHSNESVAILYHEPIMDTLNDLMVLNFICGKMPTLPTEKFNVFENVQVEFNQFHLRLNGLYENPNDSELHPFCNNSEFPEFNDALEVIKESIDNYKSSSPSYTKRDDIMNFHELYMKMKYTRRVTVDIGGMVHDSTSAVAVVKDSLYAARSSLINGFELGASINLLNKCIRVKEDIDDDLDFIPDAFIDAALTLYSYLYKNMDINSMYIDKGYKEYIWDINTDSGKSLFVFKKHVEETYRKLKESNPEYKCELKDFMNIDPEDIGVIQPKVINETILKRFGDLYLRILNSSSLIGVGGVVSEEEIVQ